MFIWHLRVVHLFFLNFFGKHSERSAANNDLYVPEKPRKKCIGFSYIGPKLYNMVPKNVKDAKTTDDFKNKLKEWICEKIH